VELISTKSIRNQLLPHTSYEFDVFEGNSFVDMYAKRGNAQNMFDKMQFQDVVNWNTMIVGHVKCGQRQKGLELFEQMQQEDVLPNFVTFVGVLNVYASIVAPEDGRMLGECSTICHLEMWSFGMPFLKHVPFMGMSSW